MAVPAVIALALVPAMQAAAAPGAAAPGAPAPAVTTGDDIVVVAAQRKCRLRFADRDLSDAEFRRRAAEWAAGKPVRVIARQSADIRCLSKIAFRLADRGVKLIQFVTPDDLDAPPSAWKPPS